MKKVGGGMAIVLAALAALVVSCGDATNPGAAGDGGSGGKGFCRSDADCTGGKVCDLGTGTCAARGGADGGGGSKICTPGAKGCAGDDISICNESGTAWQRQTCPSGTTCRDGACAAATCTPGERHCTGDGKLQSCDPATSQWVVTDCGDRKVCVNNRCAGVICVAGEKRCAGDGSVQTCNDRGTGYTSAPCDQGSVCDIDSCKPVVCTPGDTKCTDSNTILNTCNSRGTAWDKVQCGPGTTCDAMALDGGSVFVCLSQTCTPGEKRCKDDDSAVQECNSGGTGWTDTPCGQGSICDNVACAPQVCAPGAAACCTDNDKPLCSAADTTTTTVCNAKGTARDLKGCGPATVCIGDRCVTKVCSAGFTKCDGDKVMECNADGTAFTEKETCADPNGVGNHCVYGRCVDACAEAVLTKAYIGCEYWPTVTSNGGLFPKFNFAVAVANTRSTAATVTVFRGATTVQATTVPANSLVTIILPWVVELRHDYTAATTQAEVDAALPSGLVAGGAYRLASSVPVSVYQFNPLEFELTPRPSDCPDYYGNGRCNSYTNDASLLLPTNALDSQYIVASAPALVIGSGLTYAQYPGLVTITGTQDGTSVKFTSTAYVRTGSSVTAMQPGQAQTFALNRGDVVQLLTSNVPTNQLTQCVNDPTSGRRLCKVPATYDLTGSIIEASKPVAVIGGHDCEFMPYSKFACDHIEESVFPVNTWGTEVIVAAPQSVTGAAAGNGVPDQQLVRVISAANGNTVSFAPAVANTVTLNRGQYTDVTVTDQDFVVTGTRAILAVQFMLGGDLVDPANSGTDKSMGDPSISFAIPSEQYRSLYTFLAPETYRYNFVNIIAPTGTAIELDGGALAGTFTAIGASGYGVMRKAIAGGEHTLSGSAPFGIVVYGYGAYTSYMYPGGLNLIPLNE